MTTQTTDAICTLGACPFADRPICCHDCHTSNCPNPCRAIGNCDHQFHLPPPPEDAIPPASLIAPLIGIAPVLIFLAAIWFLVFRLVGD